MRVQRLTVDRDGAVDQIDPAVLMLRRNHQRCARRQLQRHVQRARRHPHRRGQPERIPGDDGAAHARAFELRQGVGGMVREAGIDLLLPARQGHPGLDAVQAGALLAHLGRRALGVDDAVAGRHPVDVAGDDGLHAAQAVAVDHAAVEQVGHGGQADMRMRTHVDALAGGEIDRPHVIEEDERPDRLPRGRRQHALDREAAQVAHVRPDDVLDRGHVGAFRRARPAGCRC